MESDSNVEGQSGQNVEVTSTVAGLPSAISLATTSKRKRKCLRLDIHHHRNIFVSTFYRIWMYRKRHVMLTLLQLFLPPLILVGMAAYLGNLLHWREKDLTEFEPLSEETLYSKISEKSGAGGVITCYITNNDTQFAQKFIPELTAKFLQSNISLQPVNEKEDLLREYIRYNLRGESHKYIAGIEIRNPPSKKNRSVRIGNNFRLQFSVAMAQKTPGFYFQQRPLFFDLEKNLPHNYYTLLGIELTICRTFYKLLKEEPNQEPSSLARAEIALELQALAYPPHFAYSTKEFGPRSEVIEDILTMTTDDSDDVDSMLATIFVLSLVPVFFTVVEGPVMEKEKGFKLYLLLMGYPRGAYWFFWILNQMIVQLVVIGLQVWLMFIPLETNAEPLIRYGDASLWFFVLALFNFSCMGFFVFLAAFFRRGKMATYLAILIWLLSFHLLQSHIPSYDFGSGFSSFMLSCLVPSACIHWAVFILTTITANTWEASLSFTITEKSGFSLAYVILMMIVNFFVYFLLTLYVDNLKPGPLESGQPWNYFFEGIRCRYIDPNRDYIDENNFLRSEVEEGPDHAEHNQGTKTRAIEFQKLSKKFNSTADVYGIQNVTFNAHYQRITVILGHRDSGRSTLMRLLCGEYAPTSGTALVFGYNVRKDTQKVQSFLSVCLEHNCLCEYLTVMEHMMLIGKLKGQGSNEAQEESENILESLDLLSISDYQMWQLVHWQRRVLCIAMAFMGNAPILLLDDPTKDLENDQKRQIWSLLKALKENGKTILMSTSDINEAYQIADRIVIMSKGRVAGVGRPSRLEHIFETGYHLNLKTLPSSNKFEILNFLQQIIPSVRELEGGFSQMKKAIQFTNWDHSMAYLFHLSGGLQSSSPTAERKPRNTKSSLSRFLQFLGFGKAEEPPAGAEIQAPRRSTRLSLSLSKQARQSIALNDGEINYLLQFEEKDLFPRLFKALDNDNVIKRLGITKYEFKLHDMEKAFNEVDDYIDVLDSEIGSDIDFEDFVDIKGFRSLIDDIDPDDNPLPKRTTEGDSSCCMCIWALIVKRLWNMIGNFGHAIVQVLAPVVILLITIHSTNSHFRHRLSSHEIPFNISSEASSVPNILYRPGSGDLAEDFLKSFKDVIVKPPNNLRKLSDIGSSKFEYFFKDGYQLKLHDELVIAADFTHLNGSLQKVTALFSPGHYHSAPLSLLTMFNAILNYEFPNRSLGLDMKGSSMSHTREWVLLTNSTFCQKLIVNSVDVTLTVSLAFGYFIFTSGFVLLPCSERLNHLKRYQMYALKWNGLYWVAKGILDIWFNIIPVMLLTIMIYKQPAHAVFQNPEFIILFVITGALGGFASILSSYFWSHFLLNKETSYYAVLSINQFLGLFVFLFYTIINFEYIGNYVRMGVLFFLQSIQPFTIPWNFYCAILWAINNARCTVLHEAVKEEMCSKDADNYPNINVTRGDCCSDHSRKWNLWFIWNDSILFPNLFFLLGHCVAGILILTYMESRRLRRKIFQYGPQADSAPAIKNLKDFKAIEAEEMFVEETLEGSEPNKAFIVKNVGTSSDLKNLLYPMSFCCEVGKCTAIVGPEASGLTVLYNILSGIRAVSEGEVTYGGHSLLSRGSRKKFLYKLGLCPADDITLDKLTGLQLLKLFGRLRGISSKDLPIHTEHWIEALGLEKVIKDICLYYSVVTKKKLAVALAVIGNPKVVIFDEPLRYMDPLSKYQVCKVLQSLIHADRVVIILTHELSNIERICDKLIFLINGQMQFCGSAEAINKDIAKDFTLIVKLRGDEGGKFNVRAYANLKWEIHDAIERITLVEEQSHMLVYRITDEKTCWGSIFESVGKILNTHLAIVSEYHIRRTSLQDVYDSYSVNQRVFRRGQSAWDEFRTTYC